MSFKQITYSYRPPPTVPSAPPVPSPAVVPNAATSGPAPSRASAISNRLEQLTATARYLETAIVARTAGLGVHINLEADPELTQALCRIYSTEAAPAAINTVMFSHLLDAELGIMRAEITLTATGTGNSEVSPIQKADLQRTTKAFDNAVTENGDFRSHLTGFLRSLKGDRVAFDYMRQGLARYPVMKQGAKAPLAGAGKVPANYPQPGSAVTTTNPVPADLNQDTHDNLEERLNAYEQVYAGIYKLTADVDDVYYDIRSVAQKYLYTPIAEMVAILTTLHTLILAVHRPKLKDLRNALVVFVLPRLLAELSIIRFAVDRLVQKAVSPVTNLLNSFGRLFSEVQHVSDDAGYLLRGGFTGIVKSAVSGTNKLPTGPRQQELDGIPVALASLTGHLSWGLSALTRKADALEASLCKALDRKLGNTGDHLELLQSVRALEALINITNSFREALTSGSISPSNLSTPGNVSLESLGSVISNLKAGGDTTFTLRNGALVPVLPSLPSPPANVHIILNRGGAGLISSTSLGVINA